MILYTVMPMEIVLDGSETYKPLYTEIPLKNGVVVVENSGQNSARVVRLVSSDPFDYLNPALCPGSVIEYTAHASSEKA